MTQPPRLTEQLTAARAGRPAPAPVEHAPQPEPPGAARLGVIGSGLRSLRQRRGVSQSELARRTGMQRTYLISLEQGRHEPSLAVLARLATALDYSLRKFVCELAGPPFPDREAPLGARVQLRRERLGISQSALARSAGQLPRATISQLETGTNRNPGLLLLAAVARALRCCPGELADGLEEALMSKQEPE